MKSLAAATRFLRRFLRRRRGAARWRFLAAASDMERFADVGARALAVCAFLAAAAVLTVMTLYVGFDHADIDHYILLKVMHTAMLVFVADIVFNALFRRRRSRTGAVKWVGDTAILLAFSFIIFPHIALAGFPFSLVASKWFFFPVLGLYSVAEVCRGVMWALGRRTNPSLILSASFLFFIVAGSLVLMLPRCCHDHLDYCDAVFLASSAVSMTGLSTVDVATRLTPLGWTVLAVLMQVGALGVLTFTSFFGMFFSGRTSIYNQLLMRDFIYSKSMGALVPVMLYILGFTLCVEAIGAVGIYFSLDPGWMPSWTDRVGTAAFHAIAAFTNSGFSTIPGGLANPALIHGNQAIYIVIIILVLAGGIGFPNLVNFKEIIHSYIVRLRNRLLGLPLQGRRVHVYDLNTKLVLVTSGVLFLVGGAAFFLLEHNHSLASYPLGTKIVQSVFASATARSAGFAPMSPGAFLNVTVIMMAFLMWIGGASQSMAGGVKVNTFAVALLSLRSLIRGQNGVGAFGRRIAIPSVRRANGVIVMSILVIVSVSVALMLLEPQIGAKSLIFETVSAVCTNGLSMGATPLLSAPSKFLLSVVMFVGRVGVLSVLMGLAGSRPDLSVHFPEEDVVIN